MQAIVNARVVFPDQILENTTVLFDSRIRRIGKDGTLPIDGIPTVNARGNLLCPGLINLHIHGCVGADASDASAASIIKIQKHLLATGVTSFCPTVCTVPFDRLDAILSVLRQQQNNGVGSRILGVYLEGIFLSAAKKGAHREDWLQAPDADRVLPYRDILKVCICAPELPGAPEFIRRLRKAGIRVSIGHSAATGEQAKAAADCGATGVTHLFNAMSPLSHRQLGMAGQALCDPRLFCELICDTVHVNPELFLPVWQVKKEKLILITDSISPAGMPDGPYLQGGLKVVKKGNLCICEDQTVAGSMADLKDCVSNAVKAGIPLTAAVAAASLAPARFLGMDSEIGSIEPGKRADLVLFDPDFSPLSVFREGIGIDLAAIH